MRKRGWLVSAAVLAVLVAGCSSSTSSKGTSTSSGPTTTLKPVNGGTLSVGLNAETDGWDPLESEWAAASYFVAQTIYDPLCAYDAAGKPVPYLAKSVTPNKTYTVWTIGLRPGIKFQNGQPLNAAAVALQLTLAKASPITGEAMAPVSSAVAVNPLTVKVTLNQPWVIFPSLLASQVGYMAAPAQLQASSTKAADDPIGTGPFVFKQWIRDETLTVTRSPHYWRGDVAHLNEIVFHVFTDPTSEYQSLESGQIQFMYTATASQVKQITSQSNFQYYIQHLDTPAFVMLNTLAAPLNDVRVRQALEYATNQQQLISTVDLGLGSIATEPYAPGSPWYVPSGYPTTPNLAKARSLVKSYEASKGIKGPIKFNLGCTDSGTNPEAMDLLQSQWAKVGIDVSLSYTEQATYINNAIFGSYQANCWIQFGSIDPDNDAVWWFSQDAKPIGQVALNFARLDDPTVDHELTVGRESANFATRKAAYGAVWQQFAKEAPYIWLGRGPNALVWTPTVHGMGDAVYPDGQHQDSLGSDAVVWIDQLWMS